MDFRKKMIFGALHPIYTQTFSSFGRQPLHKEHTVYQIVLFPAESDANGPLVMPPPKICSS